MARCSAAATPRGVALSRNATRLRGRKDPSAEIPSGPPRRSLLMAGRFSEEALAPSIRLRVDKKLGLQEIGDLLEAEKIATPDGGRWWPGTVRWVLHQAAANGDARAEQALAVRA